MFVRHKKLIFMRKLFLSVCLISISLTSFCQTLYPSDCPPSFFKKNKYENPTNSEKQIIIPIHWVEMYQYTKRMTLISSSLGKDLAYVKSKNKKLSFKKYENQVDSMLLTFQSIKVISETEELVEAEYCYLKYSMQNISKMNSLIQNNQMSVGVEKVVAFISEQKHIDNLRISEIDNLLNSMAKKYDLYKYR